jgi:tripartite-type tricarboxylate transporter receptor subunit TctC
MGEALRRTGRSDRSTSRWGGPPADPPTTTRTLAQELGNELGTTIQVSNTEGANGGIAGGQVVRQSRGDGYVMFGGASVAGTWPVMDQAEVSWEDFYPFLVGSFPTTIYVRADSPYETLGDVLSAIEENPGGHAFGTTGAGGNGHIFASLVLQAAGLEGDAEAIPYDGGREAGQFLRSGAVEFAATTMGDLSDLATAGEIRPVANLHEEDMEFEGVTYPSVLEEFPELEPYTAINPGFGIYLTRDTPPEIVERFSEAFLAAAESETFKQAFVDERGGILEPAVGQEADAIMSQVESGRSWPLYELGIAPNNPEERGIPRIEDWSWPPHERAEQAEPWPEGVEQQASAR